MEEKNQNIYKPGTILNSEEYYLIKENYAYQIIIEKSKNHITIKNKNYVNIFNFIKIDICFGNMFNTLDEYYDYLINLFDENKVSIKCINNHKLSYFLYKG